MPSNSELRNNFDPLDLSICPGQAGPSTTSGSPIRRKCCKSIARVAGSFKGSCKGFGRFGLKGGLYRL